MSVQKFRYSVVPVPDLVPADNYGTGRDDRGACHASWIGVQDGL